MTRKVAPKAHARKGRTSGSAWVAPDDPSWLSVERANFLEAVDAVQPAAWLRLQAEAAPLLQHDPGRARRRAERWLEGVGIHAPWAVAYAMERLEREPWRPQDRADARRAAFGWRPIEGQAPAPDPVVRRAATRAAVELGMVVPARVEKEGAPPAQPLMWDPFCETEERFRERVEAHVAERRAWLERLGATPVPYWTAYVDRQAKEAHRAVLAQLARRVVLATSVEDLATEELAEWSRAQLRAKTPRLFVQERVRNRAREIRDRTDALARLIGVEPPRLQAGRRPRNAGPRR